MALINDAKKAYMGGNEAKAIYMGNTKVWPVSKGKTPTDMLRDIYDRNEINLANAPVYVAPYNFTALPLFGGGGEVTMQTRYNGVTRGYGTLKDCFAFDGPEDCLWFNMKENYLSYDKDKYTTYLICADKNGVYSFIINYINYSRSVSLPRKTSAHFDHSTYGQVSALDPKTAVCYIEVTNTY